MFEESVVENIPKSARRDASFKANILNDKPLSPRAIPDPSQEARIIAENFSSRPASSSSRRYLVVEETTNVMSALSITDQGSVDADNKETQKPKVVHSPRAMAFEALYSKEYPPNITSENFFLWRSVFPELELLFDNQAAIYEEALNIPQWVPWPEDHFAKQAADTNTKDWTVFPLLHTFPAYDDQRLSWIPSTCNHCPRTTALLQQLPNLRTALFSKLGPGTRLSSHTGWADLANYVLRCHVCLDIPEDGSCGLLVDGEIQYHKQGSIIVFDDSKPHRAFNLSDKWSRTVLIVDLLRPRYIPIGTATGTHTAELDDFVALFK